MSAHAPERGRGRRVLLYLAAGFAVLAVGWVLAVGAVYAIGGVLSVEVHERTEGIDLYLPLPAAAVDATLSLAAPFCWRPGGAHHLGRLGIAAEEWLPQARQILAALERSPDATLVTVEDGPTRVRVAKKGSRLHVEVDDPDVHVRVALPARLLTRAAAQLGC